MSSAQAADRTARWRFGDPVDPVVTLIRRGGVLAIPTESSYGLAVDPAHSAAVAAIFRLKGRAADQALPLVAADAGQLERLPIDPDDPGLAMARRVWPAALTVVARLRHDARPIAAAGGRPDLAVRVPAHDGLRALLRATGPLTATSANRSGAPPILDPDALDDLLAGTDAMVADGGRLGGGLPSTLVRSSGGRLEVLRAGAFDVRHLPTKDT